MTISTHKYINVSKETGGKEQRSNKNKTKDSNRQST